MEPKAENVSSENGMPAFRKCVYPYCRNMAVATTDYCNMHAHSSLLVKSKQPKKAAKASPHKSYQCPKCEFHTMDPNGLKIHIGRKQYLASRSAGLKKPELVLLAGYLVEDYVRLKKGKLDKFSEKELEAELLNRVVIEMTEMTEYCSVEDMIEKAKTLPFKVDLPALPKLEPMEKIEITEDMDPALKEALEATEKATEKAVKPRKKKGAS